MSPKADPTPLEFGFPSVLVPYQSRILVKASTDLGSSQPAVLLHVRILRIKELLLPMEQGPIRPVTEALKAALQRGHFHPVGPFKSRMWIGIEVWICRP
jgi:hypothetical protein